MNYTAIRGKGDPNEEGGAYQNAIGVLYAVAYTLKMGYKTAYKIKGFYEYVVPPLEGFWWQNFLQRTSLKVIDTALKYGYETPESFSRAFMRYHGVTPTAARLLFLYSNVSRKLDIIRDGIQI